jgi:hypothetical protein
MSVHKKLQQCRVDLQAKQIKKSGHNKFAGYYYMELGDFLPEINSLFNQHGLFSLVSYTKDTASLTITDVEDGSNVTFTSPMGSAALKGCHEVQNIGAVETYQRRYLYVTALEIVEHDALDASTGKDEGKGKGVIKPTTGIENEISEEQKAKVKKLASTVIDWLAAGSVEDAVLETENGGLDVEERIYFWTMFDSRQRAAMTKVHNEMKAKKQKEAA